MERAMNTDTTPDALRYVPAEAVETPLAGFAELPVETQDSRPLGHLAGLVIDPVGRRLEYLVVESSQWAGRARRLVPFSMATIDRSRGALRLEGQAPLEACPEFDPRAIRQLSADDLAVAAG
jgi:hypothetical protein